MSKLDVECTVFTVSPLADPMRGGRWCSLQFWRDLGTVQATQVCDYKWRLRTPDGIDPRAEINDAIGAVLAIVRVDNLDLAPRRDTLEIVSSIVEKVNDDGEADAE